MHIETEPKPVILTGDRTTGPLHLGHFVGSLRNRVQLQASCTQFVLLADTQALTDNGHDPERIRQNVYEVALDYLAVGIDPTITTICVQSALPALAELTLLYLNFVTVARLERNPTIKEEIHVRGFGRDIPAGFLCYPAAQAADITAFKATLVPVGEDQRPIIEQTNELIRRLNRQCGSQLLPEARAVIPKIGRLPSVDGKSKMSKSQGNALQLSASDAEIAAFVKRMYTDPNHFRASDMGQVEGNVVFTYLDAFDPDKEAVADFKVHYQRGGLGDAPLKQRLTEILQKIVAPIRQRRAEFARDMDFVKDVLRDGTAKGRELSEQTKLELYDGLKLFRL
jgi:tryptophanyl-tRNA synthetase